MKKAQIGNVSCHFNWNYNKAKFKERAHRNIETCLSHLKDNPDPTVYNFLGYLYFTENNLTLAKQYFKECLKKYPDSPITLANLACFYQSQGREEKARKYSNKLEAVDPVLIEGWMHWSKAYFNIRLFEYDQALEEFDFAIKCFPMDHRAYLYKGICLNRLKKYPEAIKTLLIAKECLEKSHEQNHIVYYHLGRAYGNENYAIALEYFNMSFRIKADDPNALKFFGKLIATRHDYKRALQHFTQSIASAPTSSAYHNRGILYKKSKKFNKAQVDLEEAVRLQPTNYAAVLSLIEILIIRKKAKEAINQCQRIPEGFARATVLFLWAEALDLLREKQSANKKYLACLESNDISDWQKKKVNTWLLRYYTDEFSENHTLEALIKLIKFLIDENQFIHLQQLIQENIAEFSYSFQVNYYAALTFLKQNQNALAAKYLICAFNLTTDASQKFLCYDLYIENQKNEEFKALSAEFLKLYSIFELEFQKSQKPLWHRTFSIFYKSKTPKKSLTLADQAERLHNQLRLDTVSQLSLPKAKENVNYVHASLTLIMTDSTHEKNGTHSRIPVEIPLLIKEKELSKPKHVTTLYSFKVDGKGEFSRSELLLEDVLASKPIAKHSEITQQYKDGTNPKFHREFHCSERALYGYLNKADVLQYIVSSIKKRFPNVENMKVYALIIDIHSVRYLCMNCEESMFFWYNPKRKFVQSLANLLEKNGFKLPTKSGALKCVARVSAEKPGYKQPKVAAADHISHPIDIKELTSENTMLLLQRDNSEIEATRPTHETFTNVKAK